MESARSGRIEAACGWNIVDIVDAADGVDNRVPGTGLKMGFMVCPPTNTHENA